MSLATLAAGIAIGVVLGLVAARLLGRRRVPDPEPRFEPVAVAVEPRPQAEPAPAASPLRLDEVRDDDLLSELVARNRRLSRDTTERLRRDRGGPPPPDQAVSGPDIDLLERTRKLDEDTRRRLSR